MATEFNTIYGDRYGLHTPDIAGFFNNWWVLTMRCIGLISPRAGETRTGSLSPSPCCVWEATPIVSYRTITAPEVDSA
jgi:hypothetical protein